MDTTELQLPKIEYHVLPLSAVTVHNNQAPAVAGAVVRPPTARERLNVRIELDGSDRFTATPRFWSSLFARFGFSGSIFRYYNHQEVFERIADKTPGVRLRFCTERADDGVGKMLAVSNPLRPVINPELALSLLESTEGKSAEYAQGIISSFHTPASGERLRDIQDEAFRNQFMLHMPLDGYGEPSTYLSLLRQVCSNGLVAMAPAFHSGIKIGDEDPIYGIRRAIRTFDNEEGFQAVRERMEAARMSPASLRECNGLNRLVRNIGDLALTKRYERVVGDLCGFYGVASLEAISSKKLRLLPAKCRVYDLMNLASEMATHHLHGAASKSLHGWIGSTICEEYDLEGTANSGGDFRDLFLANN